MPFGSCLFLPVLQRSALVNKEALWKPPEISGWLEKQDPSRRKKWIRRFFVLKGSYLFYFPQSSSKDPEGIIPLEYAKIEPSEESKELDSLRYTILIQLNRAYEQCCVCMTHKLASSKQEIQDTWLSALTRAILPLRVLVRELHANGKMDDLLADQERMQQSWKTKVSFFRPGRLLDEDESDALSSRPDKDPDKPDPLNTQTVPLSNAIHEPAGALEGAMLGPTGNGEKDALQTIIDRRFSRTSSIGTNSQSGLNLSKILPQSISTDEKIPAVYEQALEHYKEDEFNSTSPSRPSRQNLNRPVTDDSFPTELHQTIRRNTRVQGNPSRETEYLDVQEEPMLEEDHLDEISVASFNHTPQQTFDSIGQQRRISRPGPGISPIQSRESTPFPGFNTTTVFHTQQRNPQSEARRALRPNVNLARSRTEEQPLPSVTAKGIQLQKRQTVHSSVSPNWRKSVHTQYSNRPSRFLPYVPISILSNSLQTSPSTQDIQQYYDNAIYETEVEPQDHKAGGDTSRQDLTFEDELNAKLRQQRARIEARKSNVIEY